MFSSTLALLAMACNSSKSASPSEKGPSESAPPSEKSSSASTPPPEKIDPQNPKPTIVLVHGAFADASSWNGVVERLQQRGYSVIAPPNPLRGIDSDAAALTSVLKTIDGPLVVAGHSYGGIVISKAAQGNPAVKALVYIAAFAPDTGESAGAISGQVPGRQVRPREHSPRPLRASVRSGDGFGRVYQVRSVS